MNFLFLNSARTWGGNEKWVRLSTTSLQGEHQCYLAFRTLLVGRKIPVTQYMLPFRHEFDLPTIASLIRIVHHHRIDVLIPTKRKEYVLAGIVSKICGCTNIMRLGIVRDFQRKPFQSFVFNKLADGVIVNAEPVRKKLLESGFRNPERIRVIHNGLNTHEIVELAGKQTVDIPFGFIVSSMGELSQRKGFDMLIRSFAKFLYSSGAQNAGLVLIGEGPSKNSLQQLAHSLNIERHVIFTGFLDNPYPYLAASQVFAMTSMNEGISNALLEAALLKNALISTTAGGGIQSVIREGENGFLLDYGDDKKLASILKKLYEHPEVTTKTADEAAKTVTKMFSMEHMTQEITDFCKTLQKHQPQT